METHAFDYIYNVVKAVTCLKNLSSTRNPMQHTLFHHILIPNALKLSSPCALPPITLIAFEN